MTFFRPDVPTVIMRHTELTYQQKAFLLWCWDCRETEDRCDLISKRQNCRLRDKTIQEYADFFGIHRPEMSLMLSHFSKLGIFKKESIGTENEVWFIDFTLF